MQPTKKSLDGMVRRAGVRIVKDLAGQPQQKLISLQARGSLDGLLPVPRRDHPESVMAHRRPTTQPLPAKRQLIPDKEVVLRVSRHHSVRARLASVLQYFGLAAIALVAAYSTGIGQWFVLIYAVIVLVTRRSSQLTFGVALFLLISVPIFQLIQQPGVANNMAVYVYELLVVGTIQAVIELKWPISSAVTHNSR